MSEGQSRFRLWFGVFLLSLVMVLGLSACGGDHHGGPPKKTAAVAPSSPTATPTPNPGIAAACVASGAMGVVVDTTNKNVSIYAPAGDWEHSATGVFLVPVEGSVSRATIPTASTVNSCSGDSITGAVICSANNADVYIINGATLTKTVTSIGTGTADFSGGSCTNCNSSVDPLGIGIIGLAHTAPVAPVAAPSSFFYQFFGLADGASLGQAGVPELSESPAIEPNKHWILSGTEGGDYSIVNFSTGTAQVFQFADRASVISGAELDGAAVDCSTDIAVASVEFADQMFIADLTQATFTAGSPGSWTAPGAAQVQTLVDTAGLTSTGISVAPAGHVGVMQAEFGGTLFAGFRLPATSGTGMPAVQDWVEANVPNPPADTWSNTFDPHGVTTFVSPSSGNPFGVLLNADRKFIAVVDINALLAAPRVAGTHNIDPTFNLVSNGVLRFVSVP
jgi:hypothetical protein